MSVPFKPNPLFQRGVVTTNGDGLTINDVTDLFQTHRDAVFSAQSQAAIAKEDAQKAKDAADALAKQAEMARQDAETLAAQAAALESEVQVKEAVLAEAETETRAGTSFAEEFDQVEHVVSEDEVPSEPTADLEVPADVPTVVEAVVKKTGARRPKASTAE